MSGLTTHVLDLSTGLPAKSVRVMLLRREGSAAPATVAERTTDDDGRVMDFLDGAPLQKGRYQLVFVTGEYFSSQQKPAFHPQVVVEFEVTEPERHHHVPLLLSPFGYSTYRGS